jgi:uncharacterized protein YecE (DUF72 family)
MKDKDSKKLKELEEELKKLKKKITKQERMDIYLLFSPR